MWKNIEMSTYCSTQTFHTTTKSYFFINVQFCLEMRTIFLPLTKIVKTPVQLAQNLLVHVKKQEILNTNV